MGISIRMMLAAGVLAASAGAGPATAQEGPGADCAPVLAALQGMGAAPRYHWTMSAKTPTRRRPFEREQIVLDDVVYLTPDNGRWMKQQITAAERMARMADDIARNPIGDCHLAAREEVGRAPMLVYTYRQGAVVGEGTPSKRIWIGAEDNLPHAFTSTQGPVQITMKVEYNGFEAPLR
jgi:hypothetical protein